MRVVMGYDVHRFVRDETLVLGGVNIPYTYGLKGHSDADVVVHSLIDALLGAAGLGDIGDYFPDNEAKYRNINSMILLKETFSLLSDYNYRINNIDIVIIAETPKLASYKEEMLVNLSQVVQVEESRINLKATTTEGLGFTGQKKGIAVQTIVSIFKQEE